jgi:hypothetical protein
MLVWFVLAVVVSSSLWADAATKRPEGANKSDSTSRAAKNELTVDLSTASPREKIDALIEKGWKDYELAPSEREDDWKWCRRAYLDILGRIPSFQEMEAFAKDREKDRRTKLVQTLLYDDKYTEEYAANWSTIWTNILIGRNGGMEDRSLTNREGMEKYLRDSFARNKPYNQMVYELITATGASKPGADNFNGAVNYLAMKVNEEDATQATSSVSRIFLGLQVQCTQCHDHPFNEWKQRKFWELNAFFRQSRSLRRFVKGTNDVEFIELTNEDFPGEGGNPEEAEIFYELRNSVVRTAFPVFVDGTAVGHSGYLSEIDRRTALGKLVVASPYMDKAIVNRMFSYFLGYGFTRPIDDLGPHNPPTHPELLDQLAKDFRQSSYNLKSLIEWIVLSKPYQLSSTVTKANESDDPNIGEPPRFSHFYARQMSAEQLYQSLVIATQVNRNESLERQQANRNQWLQQFVVAFGTDEGDETTTFNGSIPQALMMFNGDLMRDAVSIEPGSWLRQISDNKAPIAQKVNYLFAAGLARRAKPNELNIAKGLLIERKGNEAEMFQDLWWSILNSNEFILIH